MGFDTIQINLVIHILGLKKREFFFTASPLRGSIRRKKTEEWTRSVKNAFVSGSFLIVAPSKKLNSSLIFHRMLPQNDSNENLFILLWENLRICNRLKTKFWENCYSKLLIFIRDVFFCFGHPLKNWIARSFLIGFRPKMTQMKIYLCYFEKI